MTPEGNISLPPEVELQAKKEEFSAILDSISQSLKESRNVISPRWVRKTTPWVPAQLLGQQFELCLQQVHYPSRGNLIPAREVYMRDSAGKNKRGLFNCDDVTGQRWTGQEGIRTLQGVQGCINTLQLLEYGLQRVGK